MPLTFEKLPPSLQLWLASLCPGYFISGFKDQDALRFQRQAECCVAGLKVILQPQVDEAAQNGRVTIPGQHTDLQLPVLMQIQLEFHVPRGVARHRPLGLFDLFVVQSDHC